MNPADMSAFVVSIAIPGRLSSSGTLEIKASGSRSVELPSGAPRKLRSRRKLKGQRIPSA